MSILNESNFTKLSAKQRLDMKLKGLNPLDANEVKAYLENKGNIRAPQNESLKRIKTLIGDQALSNKNLGHGNHSDYMPSLDEDGFKSHEPKNVREQLEEDMQYYGSSNNLNSGTLQLQSFLENENVSKKANIPTNINLIFEQGYNLTIQYLNSFITNIKNPSTKNRIELFNKLKICIQKEQSYKNNPQASKAYKSGCIKGENEMYINIKK